MTVELCRIRPDGKICVGRSELVERITSSAFSDRATLLFGGRQAGKTSLLRRIDRDVNACTVNALELGDLDAAVYINLMTMDYEAGPSEFFRHLTHQLKKTCENRIERFDLSVLPSDTSKSGSAADLFHEDISAIFKASGEVELRALFLLDESQRVLGKRFPRGFQDNLFALLYGSEIADSERVGMVFAGGSELYGFCEDETSPIGSRAAIHTIKNLTRDDVLELLQILLPTGSDLEGWADRIWSSTGGQAGLTARLVERVCATPKDAIIVDFDAAFDDLKRRHAELFKLWVLSLSEEAKCVHESLASNDRLQFREVAQVLRGSGYDQYVAPTVCDILEFTGIGRIENRELVRANRMYWEYVSDFHLAEAREGLADDPQHTNQRSESESRCQRAVWNQIERLELAMRSFVHGVYKDHWPGQEFDRMQQVFGAEKWGRIEGMKARSENYYRLSPDKSERGLMECMYLSDLGELILSKHAWQHFQEYFRDKRQLQDLLAAVSPVRNDRAHFAAVPRKELDRCLIACDDLLVMIDQAVGDSAT